MVKARLSAPYSAVSAIIGIATLFLVSCSFFGYSIYPDSLTVIDRSVDLSNEMVSTTSAANVDSFNDGTNKFVFVMQYTTGSIHMIVLDPDLNVLYSGDDVNFGRYHVTDQASGRVVAGRTEFAPSAGPLTFMPITPPPTSISTGAMGYFDGSGPTYVVLTYGTGVLTLNRYSMSWMMGTGYTFPASINYTVNELRHVSVDPSTQTVSMVFSGDSGFFLYRVPETGIGSLPAYFLDSAPAIVINTNNSGNQLVPVSTGYIELSTDKSSPELTYHSTVAGDTSTSTITLFSVNDPQMAATYDGSSVYVLSRGDKKLYRLVKWW